MDVIAHILWAYIIFHKFVPLNQIWPVLLFSILPDLSSWAIYAGYSIFKGNRFGKPNVNYQPLKGLALHG